MGKIVTGEPYRLTPRARAAQLLADPPGYAVLALCAVVLALRRAEALTRPQFWAEDVFFFQRAYVLGWSAFTDQFAGYMHTILRAVAELAVLVDPAHGPGIFVACSGVITLYVASRTLSERCPLPRLGGACALAVVLVPDTYEVYLNDVNLQWITGAGLILLLISRDPEGAWQWAHDLAAAAAIGLTGPFCIVLCPLFAWRAWTRRNRSSAVLAAIVAACALIQGYCVVTEPDAVGGAPGGHIAYWLFLPAIGRRIGGSILMGSLLSPETDQYVASVVGLATLAGVAYLAFRRGAIRRERAVMGLAFFGLILGTLYRTRHVLDLYFLPHSDSRYVFIPQLLAIWLLLSAVGQRGRLGRIAALLCAWSLLVNVPRLREPAYVNLRWDFFEARIRAGLPVVVPTNPPGWCMPLPARGK
jgi:hypothetical protein